MKPKLLHWCYDAVSKGGRIIVVDEKYGGYYEILDAIKESSGKAKAGAEAGAVISFEDAVKAAFNRTENISYNGSGAEPGVSMLKRYLGYRYRIADNIISFDDKRLWEFRYKLQHEEPRVKVVSNSDGDNDNAVLLTWDKDLLKGSGKLV
jgi:hypothetical protein